MKKAQEMKFAEIPSWAYECNEPSVHTFFAAITLAGLERKEIRLTAEMQRKLLGFPIFGKKEFVVKDNMVKCYHKNCFGTNTDISLHTPASIICYVEDQKKVRM